MDREVGPRPLRPLDGNMTNKRAFQWTRTIFFPTVNVLVATTRCQYQGAGGVCPQVNKFEQVSNEGRQMSVVGGR